ncbi:3138_t:CDS:2 [Diversispora eburnea]|uniref:3138_t:CDS:1 n=1 Tax=Diversispora eburnea TaxID=1213867 RepID=A0A9N9A5T5_9GLOM|nr:3138_t:CDS:2 [Diversispora eburnea]
MFDQVRAIYINNFKAPNYLRFDREEGSKINQRLHVSKENEEDILQGYLYNIDPISFTTILMQIENDENDKNNKDDNIIIQENTNFKVLQRIPVTQNDEDSIIHIMDCLHISPPYVNTTIECDNEIVTKRVKDMLAQLPEFD